VKKKKDSLWELLKGAHDAWSGWVCVLLVGVTSGVVAGVIDIGATWLTDLKFGICPSAFYLNMEQCCWSSNETVRDISGNCTLWMMWPEVVGIAREVSNYPFFSQQILPLFFKTADFWIFFNVVFNTHCFICRPSDSTVSGDSGIKPKDYCDFCIVSQNFGIGSQNLALAVRTSALAVRTSALAVLCFSL
jgi:hypothetical protein